MIDTIKDIEFFKLDKIYYLYKTSSSDKNLDIFYQLQKYESSLDFFSYYTKNDIKNLVNSLNELDIKLTSIFNDNSNKFSSNTDKYISQISKIILTLHLILKNQEILNKLLLKSKQYLNEITNNLTENINQDKLLSLINNLLYSFSNDNSSLFSNFSLVSTRIDSCSSINSWNKTLSQKQIEINNNKIQEDFFNTKKLSIVNEEILSDVQTPGFIEKKTNKFNIDTEVNISNNNISNDNDLNISICDMIFTDNSN